jgi:hypothetical protein
MSRTGLPELVAAALYALAAGSPLLAQAAVSGRLVPAGVDTFAASYSGQRIGTGVMSRARIGSAPDIQLRQVYVWRGGGGEVIVDSVFSDAATLRTVREVRVVADTVIDVAFGDDSVRVTTRPRLGAVQRTAVASGGAVYSSASIEALVAAALLDNGFQQTVRVFYAPPSPRGLADVPMHVARTDTVRDRGGMARSAWVVVVTLPDGSATYWIDKETRAVLQYDVREGPALIEFRR